MSALLEFPALGVRRPPSLCFQKSFSLTGSLPSQDKLALTPAIRHVPNQSLSKPSSGMDKLPSSKLPSKNVLVRAQGNSHEGDSLDDLLPSLDLEASRLLRQKPIVPSPPQERIWSDTPSKPKLEETISWQQKPNSGTLWRTDPPVTPRRPPREDRSQRFRPAFSSPGVEDERGSQDFPKDESFLTDGVTRRGVSTRESWRWSRDDPISELKKDQWKVRRTLYYFLHYKYEIGEHLSVADMRFVLHNALAFHPKAEEKMGSRVISIKVDTHPQFGDTKCFFAQREGGQGWIDFSYLKCLEARLTAMTARAKETGSVAAVFSELQSAEGFVPQLGEEGRSTEGRWMAGETPRPRMALSPRGSDTGNSVELVTGSRTMRFQ